MEFKIPDLKKSIGGILKPNFRDELQKSFSGVEKANNLLNNLDRLHNEKGVDDAKYYSLKKEYSTLLSQSKGDVADLFRKINKDLTEKKKDLDKNRADLADLEIRMKTGEITGDAYASRRQDLALAGDELTQELKELEILAQAKSSADVGGFIDIPT